MATHSSVLAWRIPVTLELGGLPSMGLHRVGHDWSDLAAAAPSFQPLSWTPFYPICIKIFGYWISPIHQKLLDRKKHPCLSFIPLLPPGVCVSLCVCPQLLSHCWLFCNPMDYSPPGSSVHGISHARILQWVDISSSIGSSHPRDWTHVSCISCIDRWILYHWATWEYHFLIMLFAFYL